MIQYFISLIYPQLCPGCSVVIHRPHQNLCHLCVATLPKTQFCERSINPIHSLFWGKAKVAHASSIYYYEQESTVQRLMHALKYKGHKKLGVTLGNMMGVELKRSKIYQKVDTIIPVPLHPAKKRVRGYNQCDFLAEGISQVFKVPVQKNAVIRTRANPSQTTKDHFGRHQNADGLFQVQNGNAIGDHVLIVDDVITSGSTLSNMIQAVYKYRPVSVYACTFAVSG